MKKCMKYMLVIAAAFMFLGGIKAEAKTLKISSPAKTMYVKQKIQLKVTPSSMKNKVKWKSSDKKVTAKLRAEIGLQGPDEMWTCDVASFYAVAELDKADAEMIQGYKVEKFSVLPYTPGIDFFD